jgi:hypothetical protein
VSLLDAWGEPGRTIREMLLAEPNSRIEGPTEDVMRVVFETTWNLLREQLGDDVADRVALAHMVRAHGALADAGYVVRDYASE